MADTVVPELALPALVLHHAACHPDAVAIRQRHGDVWANVSWAVYARRLRNCAAGLLHLGIEPPRHVAIFGENCIEWVISQLGAGLIGGSAFGCYPTSSTQDLYHALSLGEAQVLFCQNTSFLAQVTPIKDRLPDLKKIVLFEDEGLDTAIPGVMSLTELERAGELALNKNPELLDSLVADLTLDKPGLIVFTSGSTGPPKAAILTYRNMRAAALGFGPQLGFTPETTILSFLPLCHIAEQAMTNFASLHFRSTVAFGGGLPDLLADLRTIRPTYFSGVPRVWLRLQEQIRIAFQEAGDADLLTQALLAGQATAFKPARSWSDDEKLAVSAHADTMSKAMAGIGFDRVAVATSGAASLPVDVLTFFRSLGLNLLELYGQTEACSIMTLHNPDRVVAGTVGEAIPSVSLKLAEDGEILIKGDGVFAGYYKNDQATAEAVVDGWLHTGDVGRIEAGQLRIVDRKKDIMITDGGKNISPAEIEALMRTSPLISECVLCGDGRKFVAALVQIDPMAFGLADGHETYQSLAEAAATETALGEEIGRLNKQLPRVAQIKRAFILRQPLQQDQGELTPTLKLRRFMVHKRHEQEIEGIYSGKAGFDIVPRAS